VASVAAVARHAHAHMQRGYGRVKPVRRGFPGAESRHFSSAGGEAISSTAHLLDPRNPRKEEREGEPRGEPLSTLRRI